MCRALAIWLIATVAGVALVLLVPEGLFGDAVLFRLSDQHGPGIADAVGIAVMLIGWLIYLHAVVKRWHILTPRWAAIALPATTIALTIACIAAFSANQDPVAYSLAGMAMAAQAALCLTEPRHRAAA